MAAVRTIICGSPQPHGKCALAAGHLADALRERFPDDGVDLLSVGSLHIAPCLGCNRCQAEGACFMHDDMDRVMGALARTDRLYVVCPVYFSGPPSQMKALLDRFQPLFAAFDPAKPKRPAVLMAVGDGGDPHGFAPLETIMRSALSVAGFSLDRVVPCIGKDRESACLVSEGLAGF